MKSLFTSREFSGFKYQKILSSKTKVLTLYPSLNKYKEFHPKEFRKSRLSYDKIFRYVLLTYTHNILFESIPDMAKRKREAAILADFPLNDETERFAGDIESMMKCEVPAINRLIVLVIRLNKNSQYQQILAFEEARAKQIENMINGVDSTSKELTAVLMTNIRNLSTYIEELQASLLNQDKHVDLTDLLYDDIINENLGIKPEEIAEAKKNGALDKILKKPRIEKKVS